jgi:hypothetical protein
MKIDDEKFEHKGYKVVIDIHHDEHQGPPWKEHDGHGEVSEWTSRDKRAGELVLVTDRNSKRYYDYAGAIRIANRDGWGLNDEHRYKLWQKLGRTPTKREICAASVMFDYEYLRGWCNDEWSWLGYTTTITTPQGKEIDGDSCWGFDDRKYMLEEAKSNAIHDVEELEKTRIETEMAECCP